MDLYPKPQTYNFLLHGYLEILKAKGINGKIQICLIKEFIGKRNNHLPKIGEIPILEVDLGQDAKDMQTSKQKVKEIRLDLKEMIDEAE